MVVFIQYIGNKDTSAVYPKSLQVNRKNILDTLLCLKKHNPFYADVSIKEENLDWMQGEEVVSIATNALGLKPKTQNNSISLLANLNMYHLLILLDWRSGKISQTTTNTTPN